MSYGTFNRPICSLTSGINSQKDLLSIAIYLFWVSNSNKRTKFIHLFEPPEAVLKRILQKRKEEKKGLTFRLMIPGIHISLRRLVHLE